MPRHAALIPLSHDHHHTLVLALRLKKGSATTHKDLWPKELQEQLARTVEFANEEILPHFAKEEQFVFPEALAIPEVRPLIEELKRQHVDIRLKFAALEGLSSNEEILTAFSALGAALESHIHKEERELFPMLEEKLREEAFARIEVGMS
jgi:iron-sulfur cluster repair protein YtfE (RIC family)